ncbi:Uncharacterised protein [Klebsiella pneumoniae subsp. rhinoscleromatis]|nr:Uncharacterised protein [Klebsiella pneumoniae subsp. rhinoscleromatis]
MVNELIPPFFILDNPFTPRKSFFCALKGIMYGFRFTYLERTFCNVRAIQRVIFRILYLTSYVYDEGGTAVPYDGQ